VTSPSPLPSRSPAVSRREIIKLGAAAALAGLVPGARGGFAPVARPVENNALLVVADARYADSVAFAQSLAPLGCASVTLTPDAGALWFDTLRPHLARTAGSVAGLTLESDLFILERLARASAAAVHYVGWHDWRNGPECRHMLRGGAEIDAIADALASGAGPWAGRFGDALASARPPLGGTRQRRLTLNHAPPASGPNFFVSWLIKSKEPPQAAALDSFVSAGPKPA